ncbi:hypothetical protein P43SY_010117 [Pythium insidiosum]|uniref:Ubiquitin-like domain-containing protein n=1 Tax=Pythium insidiosum TaxID=114742 RepID=A0AAD5LD53_PYTIN|nr:hypothetical protein P43SY_010117 [Pythium insidiosum]
MQLFVRSDTGRTLVLSVDQHATIQDLLATCSDKEQQASNADRCLWYGGVPLRSARTLADYGIQNHATLECSVRLRGGCFAFSVMLWIIIFVLCLLGVCTCGLSLPIALCLVPIALLLPLCCL